MQLVIDIGNTRVKVALFGQKELNYFLVYNSVNALLESDIFQKFTITHSIVSSVVTGIDSFVVALQQRVKEVLLFTYHTPIPIKNEYQSAHLLGSDRLASAIAGNLLFPNKHVLVIDLGTCIKYNFVNSRNTYVGGSISPGLQMRFRALHTFTAHLPFQEVDEKFNLLVGRDTKENILSGVQNGTIAEVEGFIEQYKRQYPDINIVLTGGDVNFFEKRLKSSIFADQFLILKGLNEILDYNLNHVQQNEF